MPMENKIELLKPRNFGEVINDTLLFIRANIKPLGQVILWLVLPILIIGGYFMSDYFAGIFSIMGNRSSYLGQGRLPFSLGYLGMIVASFCLHLAIIQLFLSYEKSETGVIEASELFSQMRSSAWQFIGYILGLIVIYIGVMFVTVLIMAGVVVALRSFAMPLVVILIFAFFFALIYVIIAVALSPFAYMRERQGIFTSFSRSMYLVKQHWWQTFGILLVASFIAQFASMIFIIPFYAIFVTQMMHSISPAYASFDFGIWGRLASVFMFCGTTIISSFITVAIIMQYYSLVEQKDGENLYKQIGEIGNPETPAQ